jgi:argininosuccinate lyase
MPLKIRKLKTPYPSPYGFGSHRTCPGAPQAEDWVAARTGVGPDQERFKNRAHYCSITDKVWVTCLYDADVLDRETTRTLLNAIQKNIDSGITGFGGEAAVIETLGGDEDTGSLVNLGRTLQEPMTRLQMRDQILDFLPYLLECIEKVYTKCRENIETIMPGYTHLSQAQPITYGSYLISILDNLLRGYEQVELAYRYINRNSGGCGANSGTVWPVDRRLMAELLGMDDVVEPTYDCEASQDHSMTLLFALTNIVLLLSKSSMDIEIWGIEEYGMITLDPAYGGVSSLMPQKNHQGGITEHIRLAANEVIGRMVNGTTSSKGEPHEDTLLMMLLPNTAIDGLAYAKSAVRLYTALLGAVRPEKEVMMRLARDGYSTISEVVVHMIKELGYGGRRAHRICATLIRQAREKRIPATEFSGEMLDRAAVAVEEEPPRIDTATLQKLLDPVAFIHSHSNLGGPAPKEMKRMLGERETSLLALKQGHTERVGRKEAGEAKLQDRITQILGEGG